MRAFIVFSVLAVGISAQSPVVSVAVDRGPHPFGFRMIVERDQSRPWLGPAVEGESGRQMPIAVWYPAGGRPSPLTLREYVLISDHAVAGVRPIDPDRVIDAFVTEAVTSKRHTRGSLESLLNATLTATADVPPAVGRFPLVMFAHASVHTAAVMAEFVASQGFVVAAVQSRGAAEIPYRLSRENLDSMVADHDFAAARLQRDDRVAGGPIGVIGMSNGSIAGMALQLKRPVAAVVSLDGGIGENAGGTYLNERSSDRPRAFTAPLLHFYVTENAYLNLDHIRSYAASPRTLVITRGLRHADFLAYPAFDAVAPLFSGDASADALPGYTWINRYTSRFLDAHMKGSRAARDWLANDPAANGVPAGLFTLEQVPAR
jgi:dienelactone hydrolase